MLRAAVQQTVFNYWVGSYEHAAVLRLIAWFLMTRPLVNASWKIDIQAPLTQWRTIGTSHTKSDCDIDRRRGGVTVKLTGGALLGRRA
jgi:hypothetical protein